MRILSLSCVFPNPGESGLGVFVRSRLQEMAAGADLKVFAPVAMVDYSRGLLHWNQNLQCPARRQDGPIEVFHPRWFYPPAGGAFNALCLFLRLLPPVRRIRRHFGFDLIDAHFAYPDGIAAGMLAAALHVPYAITLRGNETMHARSGLRRKWIAWSLRGASRIITVSDRLRDFAIREGADPSRVRTIPNGIDTDVFYPRDSAQCRSKHGLPPDARIVLSAGTLIERKGHHRLIPIIRSLRARGVPAYLVIAGGAGREGGIEESLRRTIAQSGMEDQVRLLGHVDPVELAELMSAADLLCLASSREGWPNVVHEALGCGTPVVATDVGGVPDLITSHELGSIVPPGDDAALDRAIHDALSRTWDRFRIAAVAGGRSWRMVAAEVLEELSHAVRDAKEISNR